MKKFYRNSIRMTIAGKDILPGGSKFGGKPDVPADFQWPYYEGETFDGIKKNRPLSFLAQMNCAEIAAFDTEHKLPESGMLYFFYDLETMRWGYDPGDKGCAKVIYTESTELTIAAFPEDLADEYHLPELGIRFASVVEVPEAEEFEMRFGEDMTDHPEDYAEYMMLGMDEEDGICHKLLGFANSLQGMMIEECEMVAQGHYCGGPIKITTSDRLVIQKECGNWNLLLQLDTVEDGEYALEFGDCGRIYFYIKDEDLKAKRFDKSWLVLQCG